MAEPVTAPKRPLAKSPLWPALLSALVAPGAGQIFNREFKKGIFLLAASLGSFIWLSKVLGEKLSVLLPGTPEEWLQKPVMLEEARTKLINEAPGMFFSFFILMILVWGFAVVDAYITAKHQLENPIPPAPIETDDSLE